MSKLQMFAVLCAAALAFSGRSAVIISAFFRAGIPVGDARGTEMISRNSASPRLRRTLPECGLLQRLPFAGKSGVRCGPPGAVSLERPRSGPGMTTPLSSVLSRYFCCCESDHLLKPFAQLSLDINIRVILQLGCPGLSDCCFFLRQSAPGRPQKGRRRHGVFGGIVPPPAPLTADNRIVTGDGLAGEARNLLNQRWASPSSPERAAPQRRSRPGRCNRAG